MATRARRRRRRRQPGWRKVLVLAGIFTAAAAIAAGAAAAWMIQIYDSAPPLSSLHPAAQSRSSAIYASDGSLIGFIHSSVLRRPLPSDAISDDLRNATVAIEDRNFYKHGGVDPAAIARAAWKDIFAGRAVQGGSTITQQLVRNLYIPNPQDTLKRKLIEAHLANDMESTHSKKWILTKYMNTAPYGTVEGETAVGVQAAAQTYFSKNANELTLAQAAMLAGLPQAPSQYNPFLDPQAALNRRNSVLKAMEQQHYITQQQYTDALSQGIDLQPGHRYQKIRDPYIFDIVSKELIDRYGVNTVRNGGLKAYTTIDPNLQAQAQQAVDSCSVCSSGGGPAAGLASVDPQTGKIVALASSQGYSKTSQFNFAWQAHRQPGSSFKTYVLTTAIKKGIDPSQTFYDGSSPKTLQIPGGGPPWTVNNAEPGKGVMPLTKATWDSVNVVFAQLDLDVGPENVTQTARDMGITSPLESVPAEGIGGLKVGVTPLEMADAYATLADGGVHHTATAIQSVEFPSGRTDSINPSTGKRVLTEGQAYDVTQLLQGVIQKGTGAGYTDIGCSSEAGKTGTSENESDAWFVGYTPAFSTAVWVGHPLSRDTTGFGGPTAGPIWRDFMQAASANNCPSLQTPPSLPSLTAFTGGHTASRSQASRGQQSTGNPGPPTPLPSSPGPPSPAPPGKGHHGRHG